VSERTRNEVVEELARTRVELVVAVGRLRGDVRAVTRAGAALGGGALLVGLLSVTGVRLGTRLRRRSRR
jgi:hypothetical protein